MNCVDCHTPLRAPSADRRCGLCRLDALHTTVEALGEGRPQSTFAVWSLLEAGLPRRVVVAGLRAARRGVSVDEITAGFERSLSGAVPA